MTEYSGVNSDKIGMIAACLTDNFLKPLYDFSNEKNYFGYLGSLAEISDWSHEFYNEYYHTLEDWEAFQDSKENVYKAINWNDFLIAWGHERIRQFFDQNTSQPGYFTDNIFKTTFMPQGLN